MADKPKKPKPEIKVVLKCPLDMCKYNHDGECTKDDVVLEIVDIDEHLACACYTRKEGRENYG